MRPTPAAVPYRDQVCALPDPDPRWKRLVYYTPSGEPSWEKRVPVSANLPDQQLELLREGRAWCAEHASVRLHLLPPDA